MPRYKLTIEYDGSPFRGWQWQEDEPSVQGVLEAAAEKINGRPTVVYGAGRTDSGVHALAQIAHMDLERDMRADKVRDAMNFHIGDHPVAVLDAEEVDEEFHARFSAKERRYLYRIIERRPKLALERGRLWRLPYKVDTDLMDEAAGYLIGEHDFTSFRDTQCQSKSPVKTLDELSVMRAGDEIHISARAPSFLHKQVRSMVGTLVEVGREKWTPYEVHKALAAKDRRACGPVAPADGLYLLKVIY